MATSHSPHHHCHHGPQEGHRRATGLITNCGTAHHINHRGGQRAGEEGRTAARIASSPTRMDHAGKSSKQRAQSSSRPIHLTSSYFVRVLAEDPGTLFASGTATALRLCRNFKRSHSHCSRTIPSKLNVCDNSPYLARTTTEPRCASGRSLPTPFQDRLCRLESHM